MNKISEDIINEIRQNSDIVDIVSSYVKLERKGKNYFGICPFHSDHTPSMSVSKDRQMFKCFTCGAGGNVFTFVSKYENISYIESINVLAEKLGYKLNIKNQNKNNDIYNKEYEIMDYSNKIFKNNLNSSDSTKAVEYLKSRKIDDSIIKEFDIGYAPSNNNLYNILSKKYKNSELEELGLININGVNVSDFFVNRVIIPIKNHNNKIVGFTGRVIDNVSESKYKNTKETKIYKKGNILFNYYNAKKYIKDKNECIIVEGNMDAIRMSSKGFKNTVAIMGSVITDYQVNLLKELRSKIILMLDNDSAGINASMNIGEVLIKNNIDVYVCELYEYKDPDEYLVNKSTDDMIRIINNKVSFIDYKLNKIKSNYNLNNSVSLSEYINEVLNYIKDKNNIIKEIIINDLSKTYNIDIDILKKQINIQNNEKINNIIVNVKNNNYEKCSYNIFSYLISDIKYLSIFNNRIGYFKEKDERDLYNEIIYYARVNKGINVSDFTTFINKFDSLIPLYNRIISIMDYDNMNEDIFMEYINYFEKMIRKDRIKKLKSLLKSETNIDKKAELLDKIANIKKEV